MPPSCQVQVPAIRAAWLSHSSSSPRRAHRGSAGEESNQLLVNPTASIFPELTFYLKPLATVGSVACTVGDYMCPGKNCTVWPRSLKAFENVCWTHNLISNLPKKETNSLLCPPILTLTNIHFRKVTKNELCPFQNQLDYQLNILN